MKKVSLKKRVLKILATMAISVLTLASPVYADNASAEHGASSTVKWSADGTTLEKDNGGFETGDIAITVTNPKTNATATINVDQSTYDKLSKVGEKVVVQNKVNDAMSDINVVANTESANELLGGVQPIIELFCGVIVYAIVLGLPVFTCLDILYITYPVFRNGVQSSADKGGMMAKTKKDGSTGVRWVSDEAQFAVENANLGEGSNALTIYTKKRFIVYILCSVMLFIFLTGNIQIFTNLAVQMVSGVISVIQGLSS